MSFKFQVIQGPYTWPVHMLVCALTLLTLLTAHVAVLVNGTGINITFTNTTVVRHPDGHVSEFLMECDNAKQSWANATDRCARLGRGWGLATIRSAAVNDALGDLTASNFLVGGTDVVTEGTWKWVAGRLANQVFYRGVHTSGTCSTLPCACEAGTYCNWWASGQPDNNGNTEHFLQVVPLTAAAPFFNQRVWNDAFDNAMRCYACERSPCNITLDCNATNTLSVSGYYGTTTYCNCVCKEGFSGPRCADPSRTLAAGPYAAEYMVQCASDVVPWAQAGALCRARGGGWDLATVPSQAAQDAIAALHGTDEIWLAGTDAGHAYNFTWEAGRLKGRQFYRGDKNATVCVVPPCACEPGMYCRWFDPVQPDDYFAGAGEDYLMMFTTAFSAGREWNDALDNRTACYACERSPCNITLDCNATNTLSVNASEYYVFGAQCSCTCQVGFEGPRCDDMSPTTTTTTASTTTTTEPSTTTTTAETTTTTEPSTTTTTAETTTTTEPSTTTVAATATTTTTTSSTTPDPTTTTVSTSATETTSTLSTSDPATTTTPTSTEATTTVASSPSSTPTSDTTTTTTTTTTPSTTAAAPVTTDPPTTTSTATTAMFTAESCPLREWSAVLTLPLSSPLVSAAITVTFTLSSPSASSSSPSSGAEFSNRFIATPFAPVWNTSLGPSAGGSGNGEWLAAALRRLTATPTLCQAANTQIVCRVPAAVFSAQGGGGSDESGVGSATAVMEGALNAASPSSSSALPCPLRMRLAVVKVAVAAEVPPTTSFSATVLALSIAGGAALSTSVAFVCEPWALEPLVLVGVLEGPCASPDVRAFARLAKYILNPFAALGHAAAGPLLIATVLLLACLCGVVYRYQPSSPSTAVKRASPLRVGFSVAVAAVPGVAWALSGLIRSAADPAAPSLSAAASATLVVCAAYLLFVPALGTAAAYHLSANAVIFARTASPAQWRQSPWWARLVMPHGHWIFATTSAPPTATNTAPPPAEGASCGSDGLRTQLRPEWKRDLAMAVRGTTTAAQSHLLFAASPLLCCMCFAVLVAPMASTSCSVRSYVVSLLLVFAAVPLLSLNVFRSALTTVLTIATLVAAAASVAVSGSSNMKSEQSVTTVTATFTVTAVCLSVARSLHVAWLVQREGRARAAEFADDSAATEDQDQPMLALQP